MIAKTPSAPYYAVIFTSIASDSRENYEEMAKEMINLVATQPGFLGYESASSDLSITVSYWEDLNSISLWKQQKDHQIAQTKGRSTWYSKYKVRICKVERDYEF